MGDTTPNYLRGFIVPMDIGASNIWTAQSSFTQQGNRTGDVQPQQSSKMRVIATGTQSTGGDITIKTRGAGSTNSARYTFTQNNDSASIEYGRDAFNGISGFDMIYQSASGALGNHYHNPTTHIDSSDNLYISYHKLNTLNVRKAGYTKIQTNGTKSESIIYTELSGITQTQYFHPNMISLEDDSLMYFHLIENDGEANIRAHRSEDGGSTWVNVSRETLKESIPVGTATGAGTATFNIQRIRIAQTGGTILMLIEANSNNTSTTKRNQLFQYISIDSGCSFERITTDAQLDDNSFHSVDLKVRLGSFIVQYCASTTTIHFMTLPSGSSSIHLMRVAQEHSTVETGTVTLGTNDFMTSGDTALICDDDGSIYSIYLNHARVFYAMKMSSLGVVWEIPNGGSIAQYSNIFNTDDINSTLRSINGNHWMGRGIIASNLETTLTIDDSLCLVYMGGYANVNLPKTAYASGFTDSNRACYLANYLPVDEPSNISGLTVTGTASDTISNGVLSIESSAVHNSNRYYAFNDLTQGIVVTDNAIYKTQGIILRASFKVLAGGSVTSGSDNAGIYISIDDGTSANYAVKLIASTTQFRLFDNVGSSTIGTVSVDMTAGINIYIAIANGKVSTFYRALDNQELRKFTTGPTSASLTNGGGSSAGYVVQWGHLNYATTTTMQSSWQGVHVSSLGGTGVQFASGFDNPNDLNARLYPPRGRYAYVYDGVRISSTGGSTYEGDSWQIETSYNYPVENIFHSVAPTPRMGWRSASVASGSVAAQSISFRWNPDTGATNSENHPNDLMAIHLNQINWMNGEIYYYDSGAWTSLGNITNNLRTGCTVSGRTVRGTTTAQEFYFTLNELAGWTCYFLDGATRHYRKVLSNTEGILGGTATSTKQCIVTVDEPPPATSTFIYLLPPNLSIIMNMNGKKSQGFKLEIDSQETYDKDIRIGEIIIGPVILPGRQYSRGRTISIESGTETLETQDGIRYSRELKPPTRVFRLAWTDGIDISTLQGEEPTPDYWISSNQANAEPIAIQNDAPDLMMNLLSYLQGNLTPIVYLPNISKSTSASGDFRQLKRAKEQALVTLDSDVSIENVLGDELQGGNGSAGTIGEVFRIASIVLREVT